MANKPNNPYPTPAGTPAPVNYGNSPGAGASGAPGVWKNGLCSCLEDIPQCLLTWCSPCIPYGRTQSIVATGSDADWVMWCVIFWAVSNFTGCACILEVMTRSNLRAKHNIPGSLGMDIFHALYCIPCAIQQDARQVGQEGCNSAPPGAQGMH